MWLLSCLQVVIAAAVSLRVEAFQFTLQRSRPSSPPKLFSSLGTFVNVAENAPRDVPTMEGWAANCGLQRADGLQLTSDDGQDVSVMTTQDLPANSPVLMVPSGMILSSYQAMQEIGAVEVLEKLKSTATVSGQYGHVYLMFKVLLEYEKGEASPWYPWLNSLPRFYANGASMTSFCFSCLPPLVRMLAKEERAKLAQFRTILKDVPFLSGHTRDSRELSQWAFQIASTRSFEATDGSGDLRIAPMVDMFNHGSVDPEVALSYDDQGNCYATTTRDVPAGSPLRMSYGDYATNPSFLFARYGFLDESTPATFCKIMIRPTPENQPIYDIGYAHNSMLFYKDTGEASPEVFDVLLYQALGEFNAFKQDEFYDACIKSDYATKQSFHDQYWSETSAKLKDHIDSFLQELEDLSSIGYGKDLMEHPRLPIIWRHNEFVRSTFLAVRARYFGQ